MNADARGFRSVTKAPFYLRSSAFICGLILIVAFGCESKESTSAASTPKVTIQLNWKPEPQFGGFYAAKELASKQSIALDVVPGGVGTPTVQMVAAGKADFAVVSADEIVIARTNGADIVALFAVYQTNPQGLMAHASRNLKTIGDLFTNPGTVAMQRGLPYANFLEKKFGFDKAKIVPSPGGDLSAFRSDPNYAMQCFVTSEPLAAKKAGLDPQTFLIAEAGYNPYTTVLVTRGDYLKANPRVVTSVTAAVRDGWRTYLDAPSQTNAAMQQLNPTMDAQTFTDSAAAQKPLIETAETARLGIGAMTTERWQTLISQLVDLKVIENAPAADACFSKQP